MFPSFSTLHFPPSSTLHAQPGLHVHESADPLLLDTVGAGTTGREQRTLRSFLESRCPSVTKDFNPAWWMAKCDVCSVVESSGDNVSSTAVTFKRATVLWATSPRLTRLCMTGASITLSLLVAELYSLQEIP
jgi:hypothetical protein